MKQWKHKCLRSVLTYRPNPLRPDRVTAGFMLTEVDGESRLHDLRIAPDLSSLRCLAPELDIEAVEQMLLEAEPTLRSLLGQVKDISKFSDLLPEDIPDAIEVLAPNPILTDDFEAEIERQAEQLFRTATSLDLQEEQRAKREYGRIYLQRQLRATFTAFDVWAHLDKRIAVDKFTLEGDSFRIDCGYRDSASETYRMFDPVSLITGIDRAKIHALSWPKVQSGLSGELGMNCELHAIVEDGINRKEGKAKDAWEWMENAGIVVNPISMLPNLAADARVALNL